LILFLPRQVLEDLLLASTSGGNFLIAKRAKFERLG
jgi:hypothetical protein